MTKIILIAAWLAITAVMVGYQIGELIDEFNKPAPGDSLTRINPEIARRVR